MSKTSGSLSPTLANSYQESATTQFCGDLKEVRFHGAFHAVGVGEELSELQEALVKYDLALATSTKKRKFDSIAEVAAAREDVVAEAGDVCWYFSQLLKENGIQLGELVESPTSTAAAGAGGTCAGISAHSSEDSEGPETDFPSVHMAFGRVLGKQKRLCLGKVIPREDLVAVCKEAFQALQKFLSSEKRFKIGGGAISMQEVLVYNNKKLCDRVRRGVIIGDGDHR
eukprot:TRINITY_DN49822_c0_g1_i1.p1 TRINITY_DN49822_c0_g1~~TRINITY_DN49822_c0_g1_i1.p1  ORF type:complete len:227 (+),score=23.00 TRINITY_DN49822_c0_g1_i1:96-776(+)